MEKFVLMLVVTVFVFFQSAVDAQNYGSELKTIVEECKVSEKATDDDFMNLKMNVKPKTRPMKCLAACVNEKFGKVKDNKLNPEGMLAHIKKLPNYNEKLQQGINEIIEECKNIQDPDRCEFNSKLHDCFMDGATKRAIKIFSS